VRDVHGAAVGAGDYLSCSDFVVLGAALVALAGGFSSLGDGHGWTPGWRLVAFFSFAARVSAAAEKWVATLAIGGRLEPGFLPQRCRALDRRHYQIINGNRTLLIVIEICTEWCHAGIHRR